MYLNLLFYQKMAILHITSNHLFSHFCRSFPYILPIFAPEARHNSRNIETFK